MAKGSLKKTYAKNMVHLRNASIVSALVWLLYLGFVVLWGSVSMTMWSWLLVGFYLLVNGYTMFALYSMGKGTFENGQLVNVGMSLETPDPDKELTFSGNIEYHWDVLYITWFVQLLSIYTSWALLIYSVVPAYAIYLFKDFCFGKGGEVDEDAGKGRKERRADKRNHRKDNPKARF